MKTILKRCPFCGSIPEINTSGRKIYRYTHQEHDGVFVYQRIEITCKRCLLKKDIVSETKVTYNASEKECRAIQKQVATEAIEYFWNRRAK